MYISEVDNLIDTIIDNFNKYLIENNIFIKIGKNKNFAVFQKDILTNIEEFIKTIPKKSIINIIKNDKYYNYIIDIIKRYCAYYIYLGIAYYYEDSKDLYISNIIESSRNYNKETYKINNFFNSYNNSLLIILYNDIKNILWLVKLNDINKIKNIININTDKYEYIFKIFNELGEKLFIDYFLIDNNFHNIIKILIYKFLYIKNEKKDITNILIQENKNKSEYKYIDTFVYNEIKNIEYNIIQQVVTSSEKNKENVEDIYCYLEEYKDKESIVYSIDDYIDFLFSSEIIIPITEDFLRYNKDIIKYDTVLYKQGTTNEITKIKTIINKIEQIKQYNYTKQKDSSLFYKPLENKLAILYNNIEELKIIQKLTISELSSDYSLLIDLEEIRKYPYINFKNTSIDCLKLRPNKTIQCIRSINLNEKLNENLDIRIGSTDISLNIIGIAFNPSKLSLNDFIVNDLINVKKLYNNNNGLIAFTKTMKKYSYATNNKKIYYWMFDNKTDKLLTNKYANITNNQYYIKNMLFEVYNTYFNLLNNKLLNDIKFINNINLNKFNSFIKDIKDNYFLDKKNNNNINNIIKYVILEKIPKVSDKIFITKLIPKNEIIKLPSIINNIKIDKIKPKYFNEYDYKPICYHYEKWKNIQLLSKNTNEFSQIMYEFIKQYVKKGAEDEFICKSCNEVLYIKKYVKDEAYLDELELFVTTELIVNSNFEQLPKYSIYLKSIKNIEKIIEKIANGINLEKLIGNAPVVILQKKILTRDIIDIILIHTEWLRDQPKDRIDKATKKYGIDKDYSNLFYFDLKDDLILLNSSNIDQYKIIKFNNITIYILLIIICDLNTGQILKLKYNKNYNFNIFEKIYKKLFNNLYLRINDKDKILLIDIPLLCYILFYLSGILLFNNIWLYDSKNIEKKDIPLFVITLQRSIIHTFIDLINSIFEANMDDNNKNYFYNTINLRFYDKLNKTYNNMSTYKKIENNINSDKKIDSISDLNQKKEILYINLNFNLDFDFEYMYVKGLNFFTKKLNILPHKPDNNILSLLTNCNNGNFHNWTYENNDIKCSICDIFLTHVKNKNNISNNDINNNVYYRYLFKLYCNNGNNHILKEQSNICVTCNKNIITDNYNTKDLDLFYKNEITTKYNLQFIINNVINKINLDNDKKIDDTDELIILLNKNYIKNTNNNLYSYINLFIDKLNKIIGKTIKYSDKTINLYTTYYVLNHNYLGYKIKENLLIEDKKIIFVKNHEKFKKDILYYIDNNNKVNVYYEIITLQCLGYSFIDNKDVIINNKESAYLIKNLSLIDIIMLLGSENSYYNLYHIDSEYININKYNSLFKEKNHNFIIEKIIRTKIVNLRYIIEKSLSIIFNISNNNMNLSVFNIEEKNIINKYNKIIKSIILSNNSNEYIFSNYNDIIYNLHLSYDIKDTLLSIDKNYIYTDDMYKLNNTDCKLLYYLIEEFTKLIEYNKNNSNISTIVYLIIDIILYSFNTYYKVFSNFDIRKFDYYLINESPISDNVLKITGTYNELTTKEEINDIDNMEEMYTIQEEKDSFDIDDYELNDDIDEAIETLHGSEH